jgi:kinesin family protein 3/17
MAAYLPMVKRLQERLLVAILLMVAMEGPKNGDNKERGVILRVAEQIVHTISEMKENDSSVEISVTASYLEIYQEVLKDLLNGDDGRLLRIRMDPVSSSGKELYVDGLSEVMLSSVEEFEEMIMIGTSKRTVGETNMNDISSRSHSVLTLVVNVSSTVNDIGSIKRSKIHLIDLAGSERADSTGAKGLRLKEGSAINQSLSSLGNVINALSSKASYVPYRDSKLTYLLSDSLGGNSLTLVIACLTPISAAYDESVSTLRFAERAKKVENKARINIDPNSLR